MPEFAAVVTGRAVATPFGCSVAGNCDALCAGRTAFAPPGHFDSKGRLLGVDPELDGGFGSRAERLLDKLRSAVDFPIPPRTRLFLGTTVGAIDLLERGREIDTAAALLDVAERRFGLPDGVLVSAACASGQSAAGMAMRQLAAGVCDHALVVGADITSEFVTAGFAALGAVSPTVCRPYDAARDGLTLGESAAAILLSRAGEGVGRILAVAENCDAAHITAPDLDGRQLQQVIRQAAKERPVGGVVGHGTGTVYNDQAEAAALYATLPDVPLFSLKGNFGHTLGATGVLQLALGLEFARRRRLPPQAGLSSPMPHAAVSATMRNLAAPTIVSLNVGFGGLNSAVMLEAL